MVRRQGQSRAAKPDRSRLDRRRWIVAGLCLLWLAGIVARLYYFQVIQYVELLARAQRQQLRTVEVAPQRGTLYDRQMNPLAISVGVDSIYAVESELAQPAMVAGLLAPVLRLDKNELLGRLESSRSFCWVKRKVSDDEASRVRNLNLKGIYFQKEAKRSYPKGDLAAHAIGYVGLDDKGLGGLEFSLDDTIKGKPGRVLLASDARRRAFSRTEWPGIPGKSVVTTLDERIQYTAEKALAEQVEKSHAAGGAAIVQNPNTGEILALASAPTFDPNHFAGASPDSRLDRAVGWVYEPGSTFKVIAVAAALEENLTTPQEMIDCQGGKILLAGHTIHDAHPHYILSVTDMLAESSDVGTIKLALRLGNDRLYRYIRAFGVGSKTGVELPGEERGLLQAPHYWSGISIGEMAIGQEAAVTPLQMVAMYSAIANGGILIEPRIVRDVFVGAHHDALTPAAGHRVLSAQTAQTMRRILTTAVEHGTGKGAQLAGYTAAGKTGTAQKIGANKTYSQSIHIGSFAGFAPATNPVVTILVVIDSPVGAYYGADVAAPVFRSIAEQTLGYLNIPQDHSSSVGPQAVTSSRPRKTPGQKRGKSSGPLLADQRQFGAATSPVLAASYVQETSSGRDTSELAPGAAAPGTSSLGDGPMVTVPDFSGSATRQVAQECEKLGLDLTLSGTGLAVEQSPAPGAKVPSGTRVWVHMAR